MAKSVTETESKYDVPGDGALELPPLERLPNVASTAHPAVQRLEAEYYDTADLRLIRSGITLRRRRGGGDAGWHLKLPAGPQTRRELQLPLGRRSEGVPSELARLVHGYTRGDDLVPVARISTRRRLVILLDNHGESLAEVAADEVSAKALVEPPRASSWREVEVELTGGGRDLLKAADTVLRQAGLRPAGRAAKLERALGVGPPDQAPEKVVASPSAGDVIRAYLKIHLDVLKSLDPMVRSDEPDAVHQMRIAARRLRSTLQTFEALFRRSGAAQLAADLSWLGNLLGAARDAEVLSAHLRAAVQKLPAEEVLGPVEARIQGHFATMAGQARAELLATLDSDRYLTLLADLEELAGQPELVSTDPANIELPVAVRRGYRQVRRRMRTAAEAPAGPARDHALHQARKAAKRARYAGEAAVPAFGTQARRFARQMQKVQSVLGDHQDTVIARQAMRQLGVSAHLSGENSFSYGLVYGQDEIRARLLQDQVQDTWRKASRARFRRWLR